MALSRPPIARFLIVLLALSIPMAAFAQPVGKPSGGGASIQWNVTHSGHEKIRLSVLGSDETLWVKEFAAGRTPSFSLSDMGGDVADGQYNYELRVVHKISEGTKKKLEDARAKGDEASVKKIQKEAGLGQAIVQSGTFTVLNGFIVDPNGAEADSNDAAAAARGAVSTNAATTGTANRNWQVRALDQVIPDDLIVQSSACVGFDCVDGESFGVDTIRLKENNLRIHFEDTSTSAGFASNDWRIIANEQPSGGANMFAIEDSTAARNPMTIEAAAPANSLYVDSTGNIGFQQSTPGLDLHLTTSDTPAFRLDQSNAGGFTAQTWDIGGNEANFFIRDLTGGSRLSFRIRPGAPTSSIDIAASGNVGIDTASPEAKLHVFSNSTTDGVLALGEDSDGNTGTQSAFNVAYGGSSFGRASGFLNVRPDSNAVAPNPSIRLMTANSVRMIIDNEGFIGLGSTANPDAPIHYTNGASQARLTTAGVWQDASSRVGKENINELDADAAFEALNELKPVTYNYKVEPTDGKVGFIAEDVPAIVATPQRDGLSALDIVAVVTKVVQEQQKTIDQLNERIAELEKAKSNQ